MTKYRSRDLSDAVQVFPENYATLDEWGVDYTSDTMAIPGKWVVRTNGMISAILSPEDFDRMFEECPEESSEVVELSPETDGDTDNV